MYICRLINWFNGIRCSIFCTLEVIFSWWEVPMPRYGLKGLFAAVFFWALWWLFYVYHKYRCQDTGKNVPLLPMKPDLRHSLFFFGHLGGYFASIGRTVSKILTKTFLRHLWNRFYGILCFFWVLRRFFGSIEPSFAKLWAKTLHRLLWNRFCNFRCSIFSTLEVIFGLSKVLLPRKCSFPSS